MHFHTHSFSLAAPPPPPPPPPPPCICRYTFILSLSHTHTCTHTVSLLVFICLYWFSFLYYYFLLFIFNFYPGPCGGKTTGQARLSTFFENLGWKVCIHVLIILILVITSTWAMSWNECRRKSGGEHLVLSWEEGSKFLHRLCRHHLFCEVVPVRVSSDEEAVSVGVCFCTAQGEAAVVVCGEPPDGVAGGEVWSTGGLNLPLVPHRYQ